MREEDQTFPVTGEGVVSLAGSLRVAARSRSTSAAAFVDFLLAVLCATRFRVRRFA